MKAILLEFISNFWLLLNSIAFFILLGVLVAGVFKLLLPDTFIKKHLGQHNFMANIKATVLGIPLPLCSCSVIPFVSALKKSGASRSAIQTFLISTPITGADSIMATYGVFGWLFTIYRVITSVVISLIAGFLTLLLIKEEKEPSAHKKPSTDKAFLTEQQLSEKHMSYQLHPSCTATLKPAADLDYCKTDSTCPARTSTIDVIEIDQRMNVFQKVLAYAFDDIYRDIAKSFMIGIFIGALIVTLIPENLAEYISSNPLFNYILVLAVSVPLYVCATASIPLGLSLLSAGFSPGAAFIFLTAGPATNTITMSVVLNTLGKYSLVIYLSSVIAGSLIFGFFLDSLFTDGMGQIKSVTEQQEDAGFLAQVSSVILLYLSVKYMVNKNARLVKSSTCSGGCCGSDA